MKIIIVSGFLGSGKTTFILQAMNHLLGKKEKTALIINEIGMSGVDNAVFRQTGADFWEISGGCICCTSSAGFRNAFREIRQEFKPDAVLVEPSGIADPVQILESAIQFREVSDRFKTIALLDSERIDTILQAVHAQTEASVGLAQTVMITKTDIATPSNLEKARSFAAKANPGASIVPVALSGPLDHATMDELLQC
jgi:G3E family GTPase